MAIKNGTTPHNNETSKNENNTLSLTIDSNCINARGKYGYMNKIEKLNKEGKVKIYVTSTMETEFQKGYRMGNEKLKNYDMDIETAVWGQSRYGASKYGGKEDSTLFDNIKEILYHGKKDLTDNQIKDSMHLQTHIKYKRDYFITDDAEHILSKKNELKEKLNIIVCSPKEFCEIYEL